MKRPSCVVLVLGLSACSMPPAQSLPNLPPPEYEPPRSYDLGGAPTGSGSTRPSAPPAPAPAPSASSPRSASPR